MALDPGGEFAQSRVLKLERAAVILLRVPDDSRQRRRGQRRWPLVLLIIILVRLFPMNLL